MSLRLVQGMVDALHAGAADLGEAKARPHPAKFSPVILRHLELVLERFPEITRVLDPFAGTGRIHELASAERETVGVEIEGGWANMHPRTVQGDALALPFDDETFDAVVTSPTYGNRMADHHNAKDSSKRNTYRHTYGEELHAHNSGTLQWGDQYRLFHRNAWIEAQRVLRPRGLFVLNISDHIRSGVVMPVSKWHVDTLYDLGFRLIGAQQLKTPRQKQGANGGLRVTHEWIYILRHYPGATHSPRVISLEEERARARHPAFSDRRRRHLHALE